MSRNGVHKKLDGMRRTKGVPLVDEQRFILSTRDAGYRSTSSAIAELVDNSVQAGATNIRVFVNQEGVGLERELQVAVLDNGCGMDVETLATALRFGGSSRFDDRSGPGRFGMGLPNSSVSQARRLEVYTWQKPGRVFFSYLDVEEIATGRVKGIPAPRTHSLPDWIKSIKSQSGTLVLWNQCDRLDYRKASTISSKLQATLGRKFRHFLWSGVKLSVNGDPVSPIDPLCLQVNRSAALAVPFGKVLEYEVRLPNDPSRTSVIEVRFSEIQVAKLHNLPVEDKRSLGISKGAGVSIVRAKREIDYGWYFMGDKRKENYDDWWRCEVVFDPSLDEYFGVTNSKQQITPKEELLAILTPDLESAAHTLNSRVRSAFAMVRSVDEAKSTRAADAATNKERLLNPITSKITLQPSSNGHAKAEPSKHSGGRQPRLNGDLRYKFDTATLRSADFYVWEQRKNGVIHVTMNKNHPFFEEVYERFSGDESIRYAFECLVLASVRADLTASTKAESDWSKKRHIAWSNTLAAYLGK